MRLRVFTEPQQGASYAELARLAKRAEEIGFEAFFRSDHLLSMGSDDGLPGPTDSWVTLGALAVQTSRIRLGTLVTSATFRDPGPLAIAVAQVDVMSGGRVEFGIGAGWFEAEHRAYGLDFPPLGTRFDRLEEQLAVITGLWATPVGERFAYHGKHYTLTDSPGLPKPVQQPGPPVIVGGTGATRTPALAARYAAEYNVAFASQDVIARQIERVRTACAAIGRTDPPVFSAALTVCCGRTGDEVTRRANAIGRSVEDLRRDGLCGTPEQVADRLREVRALGVERVYTQVLDIIDADHLDVIAEAETLVNES